MYSDGLYVAVKFVPSEEKYSLLLGKKYLHMIGKWR